MKIRYSKTAALFVDCQKGFTNLCPNELPVPDGENIVSELNEMAERFCSYRIGTKDAHPNNALYFNTGKVLTPIPGNNLNMDVYWPPHCVVGTHGFELLDGLPDPSDFDFFVYKGLERDCHPYGACYHDLNETLTTGMIEFLDYFKLDTVLIGGLATDYCVKTTAIQLANNAISDLNIIVVLSACRGLSQETIDKSIVEMEQHSNLKVVEDLNSLTKR